MLPLDYADPIKHAESAVDVEYADVCVLLMCSVISNLEASACAELYGIRRRISNLTPSILACRVGKDVEKAGVLDDFACAAVT
jgi:hypothetical protein